ncbi:60S ribosomal protein L7 [Dimargaris cristalligena]|nr:60S ribosomal protein L7 [Dimargaris cristalligena]
MSSAVLAPETFLKKRRDTAEQKAAKQAQKKEISKKRRATRAVIFKRAEKYLNEYNATEKAIVAQKRIARDTGSFYVPAETKVLFVIRIKGIMKIPPKPRKILQLLRLIQINNGVFVKVNQATKNMLTLVSPYVAFGEPNLKSVRELVYKRGFGKIKGQRIPLNDNLIIEEALSKFGVICMEDIIHEIFTCGPNFKEVNNFLWPFKLSNPTGGFATKKTLNFVEGGDSGNHEDKINKLIRKMN